MSVATWIQKAFLGSNSARCCGYFPLTICASSEIEIAVAEVCALEEDALACSR